MCYHNLLCLCLHDTGIQRSLNLTFNLTLKRRHSVRHQIQIRDHAVCTRLIHHLIRSGLCDIYCKSRFILAKFLFPDLFHLTDQCFHCFCIRHCDLSCMISRNYIVLITAAKLYEAYRLLQTNVI